MSAEPWAISPAGRAGSERIENVRDVLTLGMDGIAHDVHVVAAAEFERAAGAALLGEADQNVAALCIDDLACQLRAGRPRAVACEVTLCPRAGRKIDDGAADDERLRRLRRL